MSNTLPASPTLIYGDAELLKRRAVREYVAAVLPPEERGDALERLDAASDPPAALRGALSALPFLAARKVVLTENFDVLTAAQQKELLPALETSGETVFALLVARPADSRSRQAPVCAALRKLLEARRGLQECRTPADRQLVGWVSSEAERLGKRLDGWAARALVERCGRDMARLSLELDKLASYVGDSAQITADDVLLVTSPSLEATIFQLTDAVGQRDVSAALSALPALLPAQNPEGAALGVLAMLARQLRLIWQTRYVVEQGHSLARLDQLPEHVRGWLPAEHGIVESVGNRRFLVEKLSQQAHGFTEDGLAQALQRVAETDATLKGQTDRRLDGRLALEMLVIDLCHPDLAPPLESATR
jgi:DNA polymerase-3 subunit delta